MSIKIGKYTFEGPHTNSNLLQDKSGVYAILCHSGQNYNIVDVGESATVKSRIEGHDRKDCWKRNCSSTLKVAVLYTPNAQQVGRMAIEQELRNQYCPNCGEK